MFAHRLKAEVLKKQPKCFIHYDKYPQSSPATTAPTTSYQDPTYSCGGPSDTNAHTAQTFLVQVPAARSEDRDDSGLQTLL
jgi:hypothetical protein